MSAYIEAQLGLNESRFEQGLSKAARAQEAFAQKLRSHPVEIVPAKSARDSAQVFTDYEKAEAGLAEAKRRSAYAEANNVGRLRLVQRELVNLARERDTLQRGTVERLRIETQIAEKLSQFRGLQHVQSAANFQVLPKLPVVEQQAGGIIAMLRRKFGAPDAAKDLLKGLGLGGIGAIAATAGEYFSMAADRARSVEQYTRGMYDNLVRVLSVVSGPARELELMRKEARGLNAELGVQRNLIRDLSSDPLTYITDSGRNALREAEQGLLDIQKRQSDISTQIDITTLQENRRAAAVQRQAQLEEQLAQHERINAAEMLKLDLRKQHLQREYNILRKEGALPSTLLENQRQQQAIENEKRAYAKALQERVSDIDRARQADKELAAVELRNGSNVEKMLVRLTALRRDYDTLRKRNATSDRLDENRRAQDAVRNDIRLAQRDARRELETRTVGYAQMLTGQNPGALRAPRVRGRSEMERIADRGAGYVRQAEEAARTGRSPEYVAQLAAMGSRDLKAAGGKLARQTAAVAPDDSRMLGSQLLEANRHLSEIAANLKPKAVGKK